jgi:hypothetical protein
MVNQEAGKSNPLSSSPSPGDTFIIDLLVEQIRTDGGTQTRDGINSSIVGEYAEAMEEGQKFPPLYVFFDGESYWLSDGFHRHAGAVKLGIKTISCQVRRGTRREAILFSVGANASHGLRRTNADKHRAVEMMLADPEWWYWSDREIARRCAVSDRMVNIVRAGLKPPQGSAAPQELSAKNSQIESGSSAEEEETTELGPGPEPEETGKRLVQRGGTTYEINTAAINAQRPAAAQQVTPAPALAPAPSSRQMEPQQQPQLAATTADTVEAAEVREIPNTDLTAPSSRQEDALALKRQAAADRFGQHYNQLALSLKREEQGNPLDFFTARLAARLIMFQYYHAFQNSAAIEHAQAWLRAHDLPDQTEVFQYFRLPVAWIDSELARIKEGEGGLNDPSEVIRTAARLFTECALTSTLEFSHDTGRELNTFVRNVMSASAGGQ